MKEAKFIKNEFYRTLYKTNDDRYTHALISFTTIRYEDKDREEFVSFNNLANTEHVEWEEKLAKRISNFEEFKNNMNAWKNKGMYVETSGKALYQELASTTENELSADSIEQIEITQVLNEEVDLAFIEIHCNNDTTLYRTCAFDQKDEILSKLIENYDKLCKKGKVSILNKKEKTGENTNNIKQIVFIINKGKILTYAVSVDENDENHLYPIPFEEGLEKVDSDSNIDVEYKAVIDGQYNIITREEFDAFVSIIKDSEDFNDIDDDYEEGDKLVYVPSHRANYANYVVDRKKKERKIAIGAAAIALLGIGACYIFRDKGDSKYNGPIKKSTSSSTSFNSTDSTDIITTTKEDKNLVTTIDSYINTNIITDNNTVSTTITNDKNVTSSTNSTNSTTNATDTTNVTTNKGYIVTTKPVSVYTGTYRTVSPVDTVTSNNTTKTTTKKTTQNVVPSGTVDKRDMVTAGPRPGEQIFTKDGATTTTKKTTTTSYNKYADLIITGEIADSPKSLVLK